ncbi:carboxymuconolactone decarboxylase family protein [Acinetobacter sp. WZC-1]|uniref:carboxymuconolactone decarboxylase family protein n=1 Tax=Acinetobacter sp. WZC-1 TaxID=3459034 RepID=UPI00403E049F
MEHINLAKAAPDLYKKVAELDQMTSQKMKDAGIAEGFSHLLKLRASQVNQCAFCIRMHTQDALKAGESVDRVVLLNAWRETEYFNDKEQAALQLIEEITLISAHQLADDVYAQAAQHLSSDEINAIEWLAIVINVWNRIAISSRFQVKP